MSAHFEIVTTDADQPHHVRVIADNGEPILTSENLEHEVDAERVTLIVAEMFGAREPAILRGSAVGKTYVFGALRAVELRYVDERSGKADPS